MTHSRTDQLRSLHLLLHPEIAAGELEASAAAELTHITPALPGLSARPRGYAQRMRMKVRGWDPLAMHLDLQARARAAMLGRDRARTTPRLLVRVDEFPHGEAVDQPQLRTEAYAEFHAILQEAGVPYLVAVVPTPCHDYRNPKGVGERPLDPDEREMIAEIASQGTEIALHGRTHRTRSRNPRRHSELLGLGCRELKGLLDFGDLTLAGITGQAPRVFVPPFNRFAREHLPLLLDRYDVVGGGPESIAIVGAAPAPTWVGDGVYLPGYPPLYGFANQVSGALERLEESGGGVWLPVVLHWGHERPDRFRALRHTAQLLARMAAPWSEFLAAIETTRTAIPGARAAEAVG